MRLSLIVTLGLLGLAGCVNTTPPEAPAAVVAVPPTTTYVTPSPMVVPAPGTTVITHP